MAVTVGGRVTITLDGVPFQPVAEVKVMPVNIEPEVVDNQDGTIGRSVKSSHYKISMTIRDRKGLPIREMMERAFDISMVERDFGRTVLMTQAFFTGKLERNTVNGEISGLECACDNYTEVAV